MKRSRAEKKPQELATKKMQAVTEEICEPEPVTAADDCDLRQVEIVTFCSISYESLSKLGDRARNQVSSDAEGGWN